ncbi:MAG: DinB family protein [Myxococcales bacterium]|nr:DinB family protein [Myxococcales bacterium]MCB9735742.1 DinB family protein [Deltaproteobacteria bacterium]
MAPSLSRFLAAMAYQNAWANHRLLGACAELTDAELAAPGVSFFPSLRATLNHIVTVDHLYVDALERALAGAPPHPDIATFFDPEEPYLALAALREAQAAVDARLVALCARLDDAALDTSVEILRRAGAQRDTVARLLGHLFQHQIHHRGQAHAMLAGTRVAPPQLDEFFCAGEAHLRAADFDALGFTEALVWGDDAVAAPSALPS